MLNNVWLRGGLILAAIALCFWPSLGGGFLWDDDLWIAPRADTPTLRLMHDDHGLYGVWFTTQAMDYWPLSNSVYWLQWRWWGMNPTGYRVINLLLHAVGSILIWRVLERLRVPGAWFGALLFAIHPVTVASVAWIAELRNCMSLPLYALALLTWLWFDENGRWQWYVVALVTFVLALLAKPSTVVLPVILLIFAWWQRGKITKRDLLRMSPFFLLSLGMGLQTWWIQTGRLPAAEGFISRLAASGWVLWFYLSKALLPIRLAMLYPRWDVDPMRFTDWLPLAVAVLGLAVVWWFRRSWGRPLALALACYLVSLGPVLGIFNMMFRRLSLVSDHLQYLALPAITALVAAGIIHLAQRDKWRPIVLTTAVLIALALMILTRDRAAAFRSEISLWSDSVANCPDNWVAHNNLGAALQKQKLHEKAKIQFEAAISLNPRDPQAYRGLGSALVSLAKYDEAVMQLRQAVRLKADDADSYNLLGRALQGQNRFDEAVVSHQEAVRLKPDFAEAYNDLGRAQLGANQAQDAVNSHLAALKLQPEMAAAYNNLGRALMASGRLEDAAQCFQNALRLDPELAEAQFLWGDVLQHQRQFNEAIPHYEAAIKLLPRFLEAHNNLALALQNTGQWDRATDSYRAAVRLNPDNFEPCYNLGHALQRQGKQREAVEYLERAMRLQPADADSHSALGLAYAAVGRRSEAIIRLQQALTINPRLAAAHNGLGKLLAQDGRTKEAEEHFRAAVGLEPENAEYRESLRSVPGASNTP